MRLLLAFFLIGTSFLGSCIAGADERVNQSFESHDSNDELICSSKEGFLVKGSIPKVNSLSLQSEEFELISSQGTANSILYYRYNRSKNKEVANGRITVVRDLRNRVYAFVVRQSEANSKEWLRLYALPDSFNFVELAKGEGYRAEFRAQLSYFLRGMGSASASRLVSCELMDAGAVYLP